MAGDDIDIKLAALSTLGARQLATTTKTVPQMQGISSRHLLKALPWVHVPGGVYRVNRRVRAGQVLFQNTDKGVKVVWQTLREVPLLHGFEDDDVLARLANRFASRAFEANEVLTTPTTPYALTLIADGVVDKFGTGAGGERVLLDELKSGDHYGAHLLLRPKPPEPIVAWPWPYTIKAVKPGLLLFLSWDDFDAALREFPALRRHVEKHRALSHLEERTGEASIELHAGHEEGDALRGTFVPYDISPREYELSVAQTVIQIHTRVADLFNEPMNQTEQQLRLTIEALKERKEHELINNRDFGLLHNADSDHRLQLPAARPISDAMDDLLSLVWKEPSFFLAHPRTIAAFGQDCSSRGVYPATIDMNGNAVPAWRGIPILACNKIPISESRTSSILLMRVGEDNQGVVGLHHAGIPDEIEPSLSVRFMGINEKAIISYLVTAYFSAAVLTPDALGILENVQLGRL